VNGRYDEDGRTRAAGINRNDCSLLLNTQRSPIRTIRDDLPRVECLKVAERRRFEDRDGAV
jgi:hypothetical protein